MTAERSVNEMRRRSAILKLLDLRELYFAQFDFPLDYIWLVVASPQLFNLTRPLICTDRTDYQFRYIEHEWLFTFICGWPSVKPRSLTHVPTNTECSPSLIPMRKTMPDHTRWTAAVFFLSFFNMNSLFSNITNDDMCWMASIRWWL